MKYAKEIKTTITGLYEIEEQDGIKEYLIIGQI